MSTSPAFLSSLLNIPNSKISNLEVGFPKIRKRQSFIHLNHINPISIVDTSPSSSSCNSATVTNSLTLDHDSIDDEEAKKAQSKLGSKVRVKVPLKVYHVPKVPELELMGKVGVLKQYVGVHKGKKISANLPYKVEFVDDEISGPSGKPVKFTAHLREDEFEFLD
ncbi:Ferredoxin:thioredoxin reductase [Handroanthus impetiginosus]|uniref:Ferredoxin:thioredoxin reductase n=1 Tax=Handroanthus impetiginosus TaxID=429701 RepID=A0A2G9IBW6_9LAMI|nr:Ferredoxin:thioredoxin reductase [Handroanthus impetiginosus]